MFDYDNLYLSWAPITTGAGVRFICGYCGTDAGASGKFVGSLLKRGSNHITGVHGQIVICNVCSEPTYFDPWNAQTPAPRFGANLKNIPEDGLRQLYDEARDCSAVKAYTACVMACRKILMNLAVREGAKEGLSFVDYVDYLDANGYTPKKGKEWVDKIRKMGNEANHLIAAKTKDDAANILHLAEMLLRFNFEIGSA